MILKGEQHWGCPTCTATAVTVGQPNRFHTCPGLAGLLAPMVLDGVRCRIIVEERQDYIGDEDVALDGRGRPVMAVRTVRDDGEDVAVYASTAHARLG